MTAMRSERGGELLQVLGDEKHCRSRLARLYQPLMDKFRRADVESPGGLHRDDDLGFLGYLA